jgi:hypothetical protein
MVALAVRAVIAPFAGTFLLSTGEREVLRSGGVVLVVEAAPVTV